MLTLLYPHCDRNAYPLIAPELEHIKEFVYVTELPIGKYDYDGFTHFYGPPDTTFAQWMETFMKEWQPERVHDVRLDERESTFVVEWGDQRKLTYIGNCDVNAKIEYYASRCDYVCLEGYRVVDVVKPQGPSFLVAGINGREPFWDDVHRVVIYDYADREAILRKHKPHEDHLEFTHYEWREGHIMANEEPRSDPDDFARAEPSEPSEPDYDDGVPLAGELTTPEESDPDYDDPEEDEDFFDYDGEGTDDEDLEPWK